MTEERIKVIRQNEYATVKKSVFLDDDLSWTAKGIMAYLYCLPNDKKINLEELVGQDNRNVIYIVSAVQELKDRGMIK